MMQPRVLTPFMVAPSEDAHMMPQWLERVCCPRTGLGQWAVSFVTCAQENGLPRDGYLVNERAGTVYDIHDGILDLTVSLKRTDLTPAGWSNHFPPTPQIYERYWRRRSLTLMTGESWPVSRELNLMNDWADIRVSEFVLDLGTSTGLYARGVTAHVNATVFAVDLSWGMLREAKKYIAREKQTGIVPVRAAAENLPFYDGSLDAVVTGGSLNEMKSIPAALGEAMRVTRPGGRMFVMSLLQAENRSARLLQRLLGTGGIQFPTVHAFNAMTANTGWKITAQDQKGIVLFSLLTK